MRTKSFWFSFCLFLLVLSWCFVLFSTWRLRVLSRRVVKVREIQTEEILSAVSSNVLVFLSNTLNRVSGGAFAESPAVFSPVVDVVNNSYGFYLDSRGLPHAILDGVDIVVGDFSSFGICEYVSERRLSFRGFSGTNVLVVCNARPRLSPSAAVGDGRSHADGLDTAAEGVASPL